MSTSSNEPVHRPLDPRRWWALALLCFAAFMVVLDTSTVVTALPSIQLDLGMAAGNLHWIVTIYTLTFGGLMLLGGRLADLFGRRRVFMAGTILFLVASILCGFAWSGDVLIAGRALQGIGAAIMLPAALALLLTAFTDAAERHKALATWSAIAGIGGIAGFLVGGPLIDGPGWEWIFFMNIPMALLALVLAPMLLAEGRDRRVGRRLDVAGAITGTAALILLVYGVAGVPENGWAHVYTVASLAAAAALAISFIVIEARSDAPLVPLRLFRSRNVTGGNLILVATGMALGFFVILSLYAQQILGYSAWQFGLAMLATGIPSILGAFAASPAVTRFGPRPVAIASAALLVVGLLLLARAPVDGAFLSDLLAPMILIGAGFGPMSVAASIAALTGIPEDDTGVASGVEESAFQIGMPLGVAILTTIATARTDSALAGGTGSLAAQTEGFQLAFIVAAGFALLGLAAAFVVSGRPGGSQPAVPSPACDGVQRSGPCPVAVSPESMVRVESSGRWT